MKTIYAIPGLGATSKLFQHISVKDARLVVLKWPEPKAGLSLPGYARLFLRQMDTSQPFYLMGVSFGGMLCTELSKITKPEKTILISSSKSRSELPWFIRLFKYLPISALIPEKIHRRMARRARWFLGFEKDYLADFYTMIDNMPPGYFKYCTGYIVNWKHAGPTDNVIHIHGNADRLLLYGAVQPTHTIQRGTHAMVVTRAEKINKILEEVINGRKY